jgi:hypothetical protein
MHHALHRESYTQEGGVRAGRVDQCNEIGNVFTRRRDQGTVAV